MKSKLEENFWRKLKGMTKRSKIKMEYETERIPYLLPKFYVPDFILTKPDGSKMYIEMKGYLRPSDRTKLLAVKKLNPHMDLRLIFGADNKLSKKSKTRYSEWATKNNIPYAINHVPKEWIR